jgi:phosphoribosylamine--glycine ligase
VAARVARPFAPRTHAGAGLRVEGALRVLGFGPRVYLGDIYLSLRREGHEVRVFAEDAPERRAFGGIIDPVADWRAELDWVGRDGVILFERVGHGALQDRLRTQGYRVVGGSEYGDRLENDRAFGQAVLRGMGLPIAASTAFDGPGQALEWLARNPGRHVLKFDDGARTTFVGDHPGGADAAFMLRRHAAPGRVLLMERLERLSRNSA